MSQQRGQKRSRRDSNNSSDSEDVDNLSSHFSDLGSPPPSHSYANVNIPDEDGPTLKRFENKVKTVEKKFTKKVTKYYIDPNTSNVMGVEVTEDEQNQSHSQKSKKAEELRPRRKRQRMDIPMLRAPTPDTPINYLTFPSQHQPPQRPRIHRPVQPRSSSSAQSPQQNQQRPLAFLSPPQRGYITPRNNNNNIIGMQNERPIPPRSRATPALLNFDRTPQNSPPSFRNPSIVTTPTVLRPAVIPLPPPQLPQSLPPPVIPLPPPQRSALPQPSPTFPSLGSFWDNPNLKIQDSTDEENSFSDSPDENDDKEQEAKISATTTTTATTTAKTE